MKAIIEKFLFSPRLGIYCFTLVGLALLPAFLLPLGLNWELDAANYRLPIIKWILRHASYPVWDWTYVDDYPMLAELAMVPLYAIHPSLIRLVPMICYLANAFVLGAIAWSWLTHDAKAERWLFWAVATWALSLRPMALQSTAIMTDMAGCLGVMGMILAATKNRPSLAFLFCALATGAKFFAWPILAALIASTIILYPKNFRLWSYALIGAAMGALPTMVRNTIYNEGNPFFPLAMKFLGPDIYLDASVYFYAPYGREITLTNFARLPFDIIIANSFHKNLYDYVVGKPYLIQLGATCIFTLWLLRPKMAFHVSLRQINPTQKLLILFLLLGTIVWFVSAQQLRFYTPMLLVSQLLMVKALFCANQKWLIPCLGLLSIPGIYSIQSEYRKVLTDTSASMSLTNLPKAKACLSRIPKDAIVGHSDLDGVLGFFDHDFVFVPGNNYLLARKDHSLPLPEFIYGDLHKAYESQYEPWPREQPCLYRKKI